MAFQGQGEETHQVQTKQSLGKSWSSNQVRQCLRSGQRVNQSISEPLAEGHLMLRYCPLHSRATHFPQVQNTEPCLSPWMSQTSKITTHQQVTVKGDWEAALAITPQRGLSLSSAYTWLTCHSRCQLCLSAGAGRAPRTNGTSLVSGGHCHSWSCSASLWKVSGVRTRSRRLCAGFGENLCKQAHVCSELRVQIPPLSASDKFLNSRAV